MQMEIAWGAADESASNVLDEGSLQDCLHLSVFAAQVQREDLGLLEDGLRLGKATVPGRNSELWMVTH